MPKVGKRGSFDIVKYPIHFSEGARPKYMRKSTPSKLVVFEGVASGETSASYSMNKVHRFSVYVTGDLTVTVQQSPDGETAWSNLQTGVNLTTPYTTSNLVPHIRLVTTGGTDGDVILFRDYKDGSE